MSCSLPSLRQNCILCTTQCCKLEVILTKDINNLRDQFFHVAFECTFCRQQHGNCSRREWLAIPTLFPSHSTKVTCIIKATPPLPSSRSPGTSYISGVTELTPLSPFLKITQSPPGIISDKFGHKPFEYSARSFSVVTLLPNRDPNTTPLLVFLAGGGNIIFFII